MKRRKLGLKSTVLLMAVGIAGVFLTMAGTYFGSRVAAVLGFGLVLACVITGGINVVAGAISNLKSLFELASGTSRRTLFLIFAVSLGLVAFQLLAGLFLKR